MLIPAFHDWPDEGATIGRLLAGYGELELELALCVGHAIGLRTEDMRRAFRSIFTTRNADDRIKLAKKMAQQPMRLTGLKDEFAEAIVAMRACKDIRNQFAHCIWASLTGGQKSVLHEP